MSMMLFINAQQPQFCYTSNRLSEQLTLKELGQPI